MLPFEKLGNPLPISLLHLSIDADALQDVATFLACVMGDVAMPLAPFPDCCIAFAEADDGSAIEFYPMTHVLAAGAEHISCEVRVQDADPTFVHADWCATLDRSEIIFLAEERDRIARICIRGPFECVEDWHENRLLVELLDVELQRNYCNGMTTDNWFRR